MADDSKAIEVMNKFSPLIGIGISFLLGFLFTLTPLWYLSFVAGIVAGLFCPKIKCGAISSCIGLALAWLTYVLILDNWIILDQVGEIIFGDSGMGIVIAILVVLLGALMGALGGSIGSEIRVLVKPMEGYGRPKK